MTSEVDIANMALQAMGTRSTISDFSEASNEAFNVNMLYARARDSIMTQAFWNFTRATRALSVLKAWPGTPENPSATGATAWSSDWPPPPWLYEYAYPSDCLRARYVVPQQYYDTMPNPPLTSAPGIVNWYSFTGTPVKFIVASDTISGTQQNVVLTNQPNAILVYIRRVTNPDLWQTNFVDALVYNLAARLTIPLKGDRQLMADNYKLSAQYVTEAQLMDANEGLASTESMPDWMQIRGIGSSWEGYNV
jgi:hypothetical protein